MKDNQTSSPRSASRPKAQVGATADQIRRLVAKLKEKETNTTSSNQK